VEVAALAEVPSPPGELIAAYGHLYVLCSWKGVVAYTTS